jgi:hypothetical protein
VRNLVNKPSVIRGISGFPGFHAEIRAVTLGVPREVFHRVWDLLYAGEKGQVCQGISDPGPWRAERGLGLSMHSISVHSI